MESKHIEALAEISSVIGNCQHFGCSESACQFLTRVRSPRQRKEVVDKLRAIKESLVFDVGSIAVSEALTRTIEEVEGTGLSEGTKECYQAIVDETVEGDGVMSRIFRVMQKYDLQPWMFVREVDRHYAGTKNWSADGLVPILKEYLGRMLIRFR